MKTHFNTEYIMSDVLDKSHDMALRDAMAGRGVMITLSKKVPPYLVIQQNMSSIFDGFLTCHSELAKMRNRGWYVQMPDTLEECTLPGV